MTIIRPICCYYDNRKHNAQVIGPYGALFILILFLLPYPLWSQSDGEEQTPWDRAVEAVQNRRHEEAVPLLRLVLERQSPRRGEAYRLLAHTLRRTGDDDEAEQTLRDALSDSSLTASDRGRIAFDLAATLARTDRPEEAEEMYGRALEEDGAVSAAYLNRANLRVELGTYPAAVRDYELYLAVHPRTSQRQEIEEMIALLQEEIDAEEVRRAEEERIREEEEEARRVAEEEQRRRQEEEREAAEARRQRMLSSVLESLGTAEAETESFRLEGEEIRDYDEEIDILD
jgi:tetratricopeptide (TPR) repeat protein